MRKILIIDNDQKTIDAIEEHLKDKYSFQEADNPAAALEKLTNQVFDLVILNVELNGLNTFNKIKKIASTLPVIMLSASGDIAQAVRASKLGVFNFLRKPLDLKIFSDAVEQALKAASKLCALSLSETAGLEWLAGVSQKISHLQEELTKTVEKNIGAFIVGEQGLDLDSIAKLIHFSGRYRNRKFIALDLLVFQRELAEAQFWAILKSLLYPSAEIIDERDLCGTLYLQNIEAAEDHFALSIMRFVKEKIGEVNIIIDSHDHSLIVKFKKEGLLLNFNLIQIPPLRDRKEDLPQLINIYLQHFSEQFNKPVYYISTDLLSGLMLYDFPGNIAELKGLIKSAVLNAASDKIEAENFSLDLDMILSQALNNADSQTFDNAGKYFEKALFSAILQKTKEDLGAAARFFDFPKTAFSERARQLGL